MCLYLGESKLFIVLSMQLQFMILISTQPKYTQIIPFREYNHCGGTTASGCLLQHACCLPQYLNVPMNNLYYSPELWRRWRTFSSSLVQQYNQVLVPTYCNTTEQYPSHVVADVAKKILRHIDSDQPRLQFWRGLHISGLLESTLVWRVIAVVECSDSRNKIVWDSATVFDAF